MVSSARRMAAQPIGNLIYKQIADEFACPCLIELDLDLEMQTPPSYSKIDKRIVVYIYCKEN